MVEKPPSIIYVWNYREWGGAQIYFLSLMKEAKKRFPVSALIPANSDQKILDYLAALRIPYELLPPALPHERPQSLKGRLVRRYELLVSEFRMARSILSRDRIDQTIVHIDLGFWQSFIPLFMLCSKTTVFTTVHTGLPILRGIRGWLWRSKGRALSRSSNFHLIASNQNARDSLKPYVGRSKFERIAVTYAGFDPDEIRRAADSHPGKRSICERYGIRQDRMILITVGQFIERKGCWVLLESLKQLRDSGHDFTFIWLATTPPDEQIKSRISAMDLVDSFRILAGAEIGKTRNDLFYVLGIADLFVLASLQEGLPIALVEAMALGLPCIATNINAIPEAITDGQNGLLVPPEDAKQLADKMAELLNNAEQRRFLGLAANETAFAKFSEKTTAERTLKLYNATWKSHV